MTRPRFHDSELSRRIDEVILAHLETREPTADEVSAEVLEPGVEPLGYLQARRVGFNLFLEQRHVAPVMFLGRPRRSHVADRPAVVAEGERRLGLQTSEAHVQPQLQRAPFPRRQRLLHAVADDGPHLRHGQFAAVLVDQVAVTLEPVFAKHPGITTAEAIALLVPEGQAA